MNYKLASIPVNYEELKSLVIETLKKYSEQMKREYGSIQYRVICFFLAKNTIEKGLVSNPVPNNVQGAVVDISTEDSNKVRQIIWDLIIERVLTIGENESNPNWPHLSITEYGGLVLSSDTPIPNDVSGYLKRIREEVPSIDRIIISYLEESLKTYNINALLSSTISLGCASEKAILNLISAFANALQDATRQKTFKDKTEGKAIKKQFEVFCSNLSGIIGTLPPNISDGLNNVLIGVFEVIRNNRNDAGHPTGKAINKDELYAHIQVFIPYCKKIYQLIDYLSANPIR